MCISGVVVWTEARGCLIWDCQERGQRPGHGKPSFPPRGSGPHTQEGKWLFAS